MRRGEKKRVVLEIDFSYGLWELGESRVRVGKGRCDGDDRAPQPSSHHLTLSPMMRKLNGKGFGCFSVFCTPGVGFL